MTTVESIRTTLLAVERAFSQCVARHTEELDAYALTVANLRAQRVPDALITWANHIDPRPVKEWDSGYAAARRAVKEWLSAAPHPSQSASR